MVAKFQNGPGVSRMYGEKNWVQMYEYHFELSGIMCQQNFMLKGFYCIMIQ